MATTQANPRPSEIKCSRDYWLYEVQSPTSLLARRNVAELAEWDDKLTPAARKVLDFLLDWLHSGYGDALASLDHIAAHLNARAPDGYKISVRTVRDGLACLLRRGWVACTFRGTTRGKASRYIIPPEILSAAALGQMPHSRIPALRDAGIAEEESLRDLTQETMRDLTQGFAESARDAPHQDTNTGHAYQEACTCSDINVPQATPAAEGGVLAEGFDALASAYAKPGDNLPKARTAFNDIKPEESELTRMIKAAESWRASAKGHRMALERWLKEKRWLSTEEFKQDNRNASRYPSCAVTWIKPSSGGGARTKYRDENGDLHTRVLDVNEMEYLTDACAIDRPAVYRGSDDLHEFVGARFHIDDEDGCFYGYLKDPESGAISRKAGKAKSDAPAKAKACPPIVRAITPPPVVTRKIKSTGVVEEGGEKTFMVEFEGGGSDAITLESNDCDRQTEGQRRFEQLTCSADMPSSDVIDGTELIGRTVYVRGSRYIPAYEVRIAAEELAKIDNKPADDWSGVERDKAA